MTLNVSKEGACTKYNTELETCEARVGAKSNTTETCEQELYDFLHCRDVKVRCLSYARELVGVGLDR